MKKYFAALVCGLLLLAAHGQTKRIAALSHSSTAIVYEYEDGNLGKIPDYEKYDSLFNTYTFEEVDTVEKKGPPPAKKYKSRQPKKAIIKTNPDSTKTNLLNNESRLPESSEHSQAILLWLMLPVCAGGVFLLKG
jgi:hypothetical protein